MLKVRFIILAILIVAANGCTTSKWTVVDEQAVDRSEQPDVIDSSVELVLEKRPTIDDPVLRLIPYQIMEKEYAERIKLQRTVQEYKPKWGFALLTLAGSAVSIIAANSDLLLAGATTTQQITLNATGAVLAIMAGTNLEEKGDPIVTDEIRYLRQTGFYVQTDTVALDNYSESSAVVSVSTRNEPILDETSVSMSGGYIEINLGALSAEAAVNLDETSIFSVSAVYRGEESSFDIPITDFLEPYFVIDESVSVLRSSPTVRGDNQISEVGEGSSLPVIEKTSDQWVEVRYDNSSAFVQRIDGEVEWRSTAADGPALLVELAEIPFGGIDVESSVPVLKQNNRNDRAYVFNGHSENFAGSSQFIDRDLQLFEHYMNTAFSLQNDQIDRVDDPNLSTWTDQISDCGRMSGGSLFVYLTGYSKSYTTESDIESLALFHVDNAGNERVLGLQSLFERISTCNADKIFVFADLEYVDEVEDGEIISFMNTNGGKQQRIASVLTSDFPDSIVLFGNRIGQSSSIYTGANEDDKRHHIFPYFWAEAIQQRKTRVAELVRHLRNNVDYTSRRLHDKPQEIRAFGNFMLNMAD